MKSRILFIALAVVLALSVGLIGCDGGGDIESDTIVIGMSRSTTGPGAIIHSSAFGAVYPAYIAKVNLAGGIDVDGTPFDMEAKVYNDNSEETKLIANTLTLIGDVGDGEVHTIFGPTSTHFIDVMAPYTNNGECVLMTVEGGATFLEESAYLPSWPYVFINLSFSDWCQLPSLAPILAGQGATTAYILWQNDAHGLEYLATAATEFPLAGITIVGNQSVLATDPGFNPAVILAAVNATAPDVVCVFAYPGEIMGITGAAITLGYNFDGWVTGPGANFGWFGIGGGGFGPAAEGVLCFAVANNKTVVPGATLTMEELFNDIIAGGDPEGQDFWGHPLYWGALELWQDAVEAVGTVGPNGGFLIDQDDLKDEIASHNSLGTAVNTVLGPTYYTMFGSGSGGGVMACASHTGEIGQWQSGYVEVIDGSNNTSSIDYPKANWP